MTRDAEGFLSRWSRRKRDIGDEGEASTEDGVPEFEAPPEAEPEEQIDLDALPDPDTLGPGDDFRIFMQAAVPEPMRRRALRRLWRTNPVLACVDGLNDYDGDFTGGSVPAGHLKTVYEVGRGIVRRIEETADRADTETDRPPAGLVENRGADPAAGDFPNAGRSEAETQEPLQSEPAEDHAGAEADPVGPTRRRMRFDFGGES